MVEAKRLAEQAQKRWCPKSPDVLSGKILFHYARVLQLIGDTSRARSMFQQFLMEVNNWFPALSLGIPKAYFYLGLISRAFRDFEGAVEANQKAIHLFRERREWTFCCFALQNLAWVLCKLERPQEAAEALGEVTQIFAGQLPPELAVEQALGNAYVSYLEGNYSPAKLLLHEVLRLPSTKNEIKSMAWCLSGYVAVAEGELLLAEDMANCAIASAEKVFDSRLINDGTDLLRKIRRQKRSPA
jgi:tetratricopeptide (TPR) repeat protein